MYNVLGIKIIAAGGWGWGILDFLKGLMDILWMLVQLIWGLFVSLEVLGNLTPGNIIEAAHTITAGITGWISGILLMSPFSSDLLNAPGVESATSQNSAFYGLITAFTRTGTASIPVLCIEGGLALTMIVFFYGFAESTVQLEKTNIQLIFSRILRWIIAVGLVSTSYLLFSYLFQAFRSLYGLASGYSSSWGTATFYEGSLGIVGWYKDQLVKIRPSTSWYSDTTAPVWDLNNYFSMDPSQSADFDAFSVGASSHVFRLQNGPIGFLIMLFGIVKLFKKAIKFAVEQFTAFARLLVYFVCAPFGLAMYAAPETQQKANSYMRQFAGATLTNLFKVFAIALATVLVTTVTVNVAWLTGNSSHGAYYILDVMPIAHDLLSGAIGTTGLTGVELDAGVKDLAFIVTSGGFLGYHLYFDLIGKASEVAERFAQEVMN